MSDVYPVHAEAQTRGNVLYWLTLLVSAVFIQMRLHRSCGYSKTLSQFINVTLLVN